MGLNQQMEENHTRKRKRKKYHSFHKHAKLNWDVTNFNSSYMDKEKKYVYD